MLFMTNWSKCQVLVKVYALYDKLV